MEDKSEKGGFLSGLFGRKKETSQNQQSEVGNMANNETQKLTPEQAQQRYQENVSRTAKDLTGEIQPEHPLEPGESMGGVKNPTGENLQQGITNRAWEQSTEQGTKIKTEERLKEVSKPGPETHKQKVDRLQRGETR